MKTRKNLASLFVLVFGLFFFFNSNAQELGLRYGNNLGGNMAIDAVFPVKKNRIHADISFSNHFLGNGFGLSGIYDFNVKPLKNNENFNSYFGIGGAGYFGNGLEMMNINAGVAGEIGLEYRFNNAPIVIGGDWQPNVMILGNKGSQLLKFGLNARFVF